MSDSQKACRAYLTVVFAVASVICGCGGDDLPPRFAATGSVTFDGVPLDGAVIRLIPTAPSSGPMAVTAIEEGVFVFDEETGPVAGTHRVEIVYADDGSARFDDEAAIEELAAGRGIPPTPPKKIPPAYNRDSQLTAVADADGPNDYQFHLTSTR